MSEQALKSPTLAAGIETAGAGTGSYPLLTRGQVAPATGNSLPTKVVEKLDLQRLAKNLNVASQTIGHDLRFEVNLDSGSAVIQVLDKETGEIIRQIPPEKASVAISQNGALRIHVIDTLV